MATKFLAAGRSGKSLGSNQNSFLHSGRWQEILYQDGTVAGLLSPKELLAHLRDEGDDLREGDLLFGGTCAAIGDVRYSKTFRMELVDPVLGREIRHSYEVTPVPIRG